MPLLHLYMPGYMERHNFFRHYKNKIMSQAFVKESDEQWLHEVQPTLNALVVYLTRENNGIRVYEIKNFNDSKSGRQVHEMSNGLSYAKDEKGAWYVVY
jgi:GTP cyclohydrolase II